MILRCKFMFEPQNFVVFYCSHNLTSDSAGEDSDVFVGEYFKSFMSISGN